MARRFAALLWALVVANACNNPVGPTVVTIIPREVAVSPGMNQCFTANGGNGSDHYWMITGGGQLTPEGNRACVLVGNEAGKFMVRVGAGGVVDEATFTVYVENRLELTYAGQPSGNSVRMFDRIEFEVKYVNIVREEPVRVRVVFLDESQRRMASIGYAPLLEGVAGIVTPTSAVQSSVAVETHFLSLTIIDSATLRRVYYESIVPYFIRWVP